MKNKGLLSGSSVFSSEAHETLTWFGAGGREIMTIGRFSRNHIPLCDLRASSESSLFEDERAVKCNLFYNPAIKISPASV